MPVIGNFDGIKIYIFPEDHMPPHVHIFHGGETVSIQIDASKVTGKMHNRVLKKSVQWVEKNREMLTKEWERLNDE